MKTKSAIKHIFAIALSLLMVFSVTITAFAAGPYTITINNAEGLADMKNDQFTAYQIFTGTFNNDGTITNVQWANATAGANLLAALKDSGLKGVDINDNENVEAFAGLTNATQVAEVLEKNATDDVFLQAFAKIARNYLTVAGTSTAAADGESSTIKVNNEGYYLVVQNSDIKDENGKNGIRSSFILQVVKENEDKNITVNLKADIPSVEKAVSDRNAGYGDYVQFTLTATLPNNFSDYDKYYLRFNDTLSTGLQLAIDAEHQLVVKVAGTATTKYVTNAANGNTGSFYVSIRNLKDAAFKGVTDGSTVTVTYWAMVNTSAKITETNIVDLTYSNDPNNTGIPYNAPDYPDPDDPDYPDDPNYPGHPDYPGDPEDPNYPDGPGTGTTVEDIEYVHNYTVNITKLATDGKKLTGAKFYLIKDGKYATVANGKLTGWVDAEGNATALVSDNGDISIAGLNVGTYTLREFAAPSDDYGTIADVTFTITAELEEDGSAIKTLTTTIEGTRVDARVVSTNAGTHTIALELTDPTNSNLPNTGGIGNTIFYVVGGMMVLGAIAYLVISKKKAKAQ